MMLVVLAGRGVHPRVNPLVGCTHKGPRASVCRIGLLREGAPSGVRKVTLVVARIADKRSSPAWYFGEPVDCAFGNPLYARNLATE